MTHLSTVRNKEKWNNTQSSEIMYAIQTVDQASGPAIRFTPEDASMPYLRAGGAMALLAAQMDSDTIRILGRWRSDTMLRYLHTMSKSFTDGLAFHMFQYGNYAFILPVHAAV